MDVLGRTIFDNSNRSVVKLDNNDTALVEKFCKQCATLNFQNNKNLEKMKWDWGLKNGGWFAAISDNKIYSLAGYHKLDTDNSYRVLFRGAQLPGYGSKKISKNIFSIMVHWTYLLNEQVKDILVQDHSAKIYISTNVDKNNDAPSSYKLSSTMAPLLVKQNLLSLEQENVELYYTKQNLWRLNVNEYFKRRREFFS